jgi:hypothetical protein
MPSKKMRPAEPFPLLVLPNDVATVFQVKRKSDNFRQRMQCRVIVARIAEEYMRMLVFPVILALLLIIGAVGTISMMTAFPELATVYPEQAIETAIAQSDAQAGQHRAEIGTLNHLHR